MKRRDIIKLLGGAAAACIGGTTIALSHSAHAPNVSIQAEILRLAMRWFVKRRLLGQLNISVMRERFEFPARIFPRAPSSTKYAWRNAGGVAAFLVTRPESRDNHYVLYLHGGGYIAGSISYYRDFLWRIATATHAHVLFIDYKLAPEHPFPAAVDDAVAAYRWLLSDGADPRCITIMGDSAGGGLAFAALLRLRDEGVVLPAAAVALSPWTDLVMSGESFRLNAEADPMLDPMAVPYAAELYLAGADPRNPSASPLYGDPIGLPRTLIQVGGDEIMLDDSVRMADKLRTAGCDVKLQVWRRMPHVWQLFASVVPESRQAIEEIGAFVLTAT